MSKIKSPFSEPWHPARRGRAKYANKIWTARLACTAASWMQCVWADCVGLWSEWSCHSAPWNSAVNFLYLKKHHFLTDWLTAAGSAPTASPRLPPPPPPKKCINFLWHPTPQNMARQRMEGESLLAPAKGQLARSWKWAVNIKNASCNSILCFRIQCRTKWNHLYWERGHSILLPQHSSYMF